MKRTSKSLVTDARDVVGSCPVMSIRVAERLMTRFLETRLKSAGLSAAQFGLMIHIAAAPDDKINALAERLGLDQSTLSRNLRALEAVGLVEIVIAETDLRRRAVWLTERGARKLEAALPAWRDAQRELAAGISAAQVRKIADAALRLAARVGSIPAALRPSLSSP
jgi:DNA-binding MarR family transcriptional regulator